MIIDWQHHYFTEEYTRAHGGMPGQMTPMVVDGKDAVFIHDGFCDVARHVADMDEAGIDMAVLTFGNAGHSLEEVKAWSDAAAKAMKDYPGRFAALAPTQPIWGPPALDELDRAIGGLGLHGVHISCQIQDQLPIDSRAFWPFYEKVARMDVPIFVHISSSAWGFDAVNTDWNSNITLVREFDLMTGVCRVIMGGVLEEFPTLKIVFSHMGGGISALWERVERYANYWGPKFWGWDREKSPLSRPVRDYLDMLYFDLAGSEGGMNAIKIALMTLKPEQLVFGTDYPAEFTDDPAGMRRFIGNVRALGLPAEQTESILGGTAMRLLKMDR